MEENHKNAALVVNQLIQKWSQSEASEQKNMALFLTELCDVLGVKHPDAAGTVGASDDFVFEKDVRIPHEGGTSSIGRIDLYKKDCFILEAKQGSTAAGKKIGTAKRGTGGWTLAMDSARGQALNYATRIENPPPFLIVCDIGYCFDIYAAFDGTSHYTPFPSAQSSRIFLADLGDHLDTLKRIFTEPLGLDPAKATVKITRKVAAKLAELSKELEKDGRHPESVATFLMRCIFTMFAEDVGLLPKDLFTNSIEQFWLPSPKSFPGGVRALWKAMNDGSETMMTGKLLKFNGGLFANQDALPLNEKQLQLLLEAAKMNWAEVEPAIFGTLLERALDPKERHSLGAHFTPKAYVERLVRPTIEEPLREDWNLAKVEAMHLAEDDNLEGAKKVVRAFHTKLCQTKVLDPACGSGNFLYVTLEVFKRLEAEVLVMLEGLGDTQFRLDMQTITVNPSQFLGIEIKRWAKEIAEMVLWIGYLQWHIRTYAKDKKLSIPEPVLRNYGNIECRDAVLAYDKEELLLDEKGKPVSRWNGETMKKHPVTGKDVPDESAQIPIYKYINPRKAEWPDADFVIGNPPFVGNKRMQNFLGPKYVEELRKANSKVPGSSDYVMFWWNHSADLARKGRIRRFGLITTQSISQVFNRKVIKRHLSAKNPISLVFAIPNHPWVDSMEGADVRVAMTVGQCGNSEGILLEIVKENKTESNLPAFVIEERRGIISVDLRVGPDVSNAEHLLSNSGMSFMGVILVGQGFVLDNADPIVQEEPQVCKKYIVGNELNQLWKRRFVIDLFGMTEASVKSRFPASFQRVLNEVKPQRDVNEDETFKTKWWLHGRSRPEMREGINDLTRYIAICRTAKHMVFQFVGKNVLLESKGVAITSDDAFVFSVLSSRIHMVWSVGKSSRHGVGNDFTYNNTECFETFSFPKCSDVDVSRIQALGESLDAHRKVRQELHPKLTITGMYNVLEKLRSGEELNKKERGIHEQGLVSVLKKIHDDLDAAVFDAYGWPSDLTDEEILERLVALNLERAEEEKRGIIRWLRPEYQRKVVKLPKGVTEEQVQTEIAVTKIDDKKPSVAPPAAKKLPWPKTLPERIAAIRDLVQTTDAPWTAEAVARSFTRGRATSVEPVLESLAAVGVVVGYDSDDGVRWRRVGG